MILLFIIFTFIFHPLLILLFYIILYSDHDFFIIVVFFFPFLRLPLFSLFRTLSYYFLKSYRTIIFYDSSIFFIFPISYSTVSSFDQLSRCSFLRLLSPSFLNWQQLDMISFIFSSMLAKKSYRFSIYKSSGISALVVVAINLSQLVF